MQLNIFFWLSKLGWILISPLNFTYLLLVIVYGLILFNKRSAKFLITIIIIFLSVIAFFPIGNLLIKPLEDRFQTNPSLPNNIEGIIVLGGSIDPVMSNDWNQVETYGSIEREIYFIHLAQLYPESLLVYSGGSGSILHQKYKEADVAKKMFQDLGFDTSSIIFERKSRNTYENAILSMNKVKPKLKNKWILITSAYHMPRAVGTFCKAGWKVIPYPVDHYTLPNNNLNITFNLAKHLSELDFAMHEWLGLFIYYITGKMSAFFPSQCR